MTVRSGLLSGSFEVEQVKVIRCKVETVSR